MICNMCKKYIHQNDGYFTTWVHDGRKDYHVACKPHYTFTEGKNARQLDLPLKEKRDELP